MTFGRLAAYISVFFISLVPFLEVKAAFAFAATMKLSIPLTAVVAFISTSLAIVVFANIFVPIMDKLKSVKFIGFFAKKMEKQAQEKKQKLEAKQNKKLNSAKQFSKYLSVLLFVISPLPGSGIFLGTLICTFMGLEKKRSILTMICANFVCVLAYALVFAGVISLF
ncbi:MAG: small multi-drug export protein [Firmicutes bacterium]|nr:small multi-drug export protein [Bacillota bacterium]MCL2771379.1 small multi-drug export protein [Bacillota bacterium]